MKDKAITKVILQQTRFVAWLKEQGLYEKLASTHMMQEQQRVWEACGSPKANGETR